MCLLAWEPEPLPEKKKNNGGGGLAGKMTPCAVLVIQNGTTKLVNVKNQDGLTKVLDMVPDFVNRFAPGGSSGSEEPLPRAQLPLNRRILQNKVFIRRRSA